MRSFKKNSPMCKFFYGKTPIYKQRSTRHHKIKEEHLSCYLVQCTAESKTM